MSAISSTIASISPSEAIGVGLIGVGIVAASPALLPIVGFTASGVAAGSMAAAAQSMFYGPLTSGAFSVLQFAGTAATPYLGTAAASLSAGVVLKSERLQEALFNAVQGGATAAVPAAEAVSDAAVAAGGRAKDAFWVAVEGGATAAAPAAEAVVGAAVAAGGRLQEAIKGAVAGAAAAEGFSDKAIAAGERVRDALCGASHKTDLD